MASSLRLIASNLFARSLPPTAVSSSRFLSIDAGYRSYTTTTKDDFNDQSSLRIVWPEISSMSFNMRNIVDTVDKNRTLTLKLPNDGLIVRLEKARLNLKDMRACAAKQNHSDIKKEVKDEMLKVTLPNEDELKNTNIILNNMANHIITSFYDITAKRGWSYYDMFNDRSILGEGLCRVIAMSSLINSFTLYKLEDDEDLEIFMDIPGLKLKMKMTMQGLRVSLDMPCIGREDVKTFFEYDTFFIEGKTDLSHYIAGIHLPKGFHMRHNMIKRKMVGHVFYAFLSCSGKKEELLEQLKLV